MTTETILASTVYGTASGNYDGSSQDFASDAVRAANYYAGQGSIQTILMSLAGVQGLIFVQATLNDNPDSAIWFDIAEYGSEFSPLTDVHSVTVTGNYVWLRARIIGFDAGTINSITVTY